MKIIGTLRKNENIIFLETKCTHCGMHSYSLIPFNLFIQSYFNANNFSGIISNFITTCIDRNKHRVLFPFEDMKI